jgi:predicted signal transduction protein with EAL and GGDEF domain
MEAAPVSRTDIRAAVRARNVELSGQLRCAVMDGDDARIARLLSDLLRVQGLTKGQRISLQLKALLNLVDSLRAAALNDELTGLYNRRGFVQTATRLLDVAVRDAHPANLVYFDVGQLRLVREGAGHAADDVQIRQMASTKCSGAWAPTNSPLSRPIRSMQRAARC